MRSLPFSAASCFVALIGCGVPLSASGPETASVLVTASFTSKSSLRVSTELLRFDAGESGEAQVAVEFAAGARTRRGGEVVLTVEPVRAIVGPGGTADVETAVAFTGEGAGTQSGPLNPVSPSTAGRWTGSGLRTGRLVFALRAEASGTYILPVRFVLSTP
jgi:hypothetical protein